MKDLGSHSTAVGCDSSWRERQLDGFKVKEKRRRARGERKNTKFPRRKLLSREI